MQSVRLGDLSMGHSCWPARPNIEGSANVFVNGIAVHCTSHNWAVHCCTNTPFPCHTGVAGSGSPNVFANGLARSRVGDSITCGDTMATGSTDVYLNG